MTCIRLMAYDQNLSADMRPKLASGNKQSVYISVSFSRHWSEYKKSAVFYASWDRSIYECLLDGGECVVPHEVLQLSGYLYIGIRGVDPATQKIKVSDLVKLRIEKGAPPGDATTKEPTPDVYQQILKKLDFIQTGGIDEEKVHDIIVKYLTENPPSVDAASPEDIRNAVNEYLKENPPSGFETDHTLTLKDGVLSVNTTDLMAQDNTLPMTSAGVYATVGNIEALLKTI